MMLAPKLGRFAREYPDVVLDVTTTMENHVELAAERFDAGIHLGEFIDRDLVAVRVSRDHRLAIVGSPGYFDTLACRRCDAAPAAPPLSSVFSLVSFFPPISILQ